MALAQDEPGAPEVRRLLEEGVEGDHDLFMTVVNFGEVMYTIEMRHGLEAAQEMLATIEKSPIQIVDVDRELGLKAAALKAQTGVGYADCFVGALADQLNAAIVTGDKDFRLLEGRVVIDWLPGPEA
jgi:predicted nucleic acid-binding protein